MRETMMMTSIRYAFYMLAAVGLWLIMSGCTPTY